MLKSIIFQNLKLQVFYSRLYASIYHFHDGCKMSHSKPYLQKGIVNNSQIPQNVTLTKRMTNLYQFSLYKFILLKPSGYAKRQTSICVCMLVSCYNVIIIGQFFAISTCTLN